MKVGTKSVLFGVHCFFIHPLFVALAWWKLYGFPFDPRLWFAFFLHDIGYWGKPNMDGEEGETHVELGAKVMTWLFGKRWGDFTMYHSRFYCRKHGKRMSKLCVADKYSFCLTPKWLYMIQTKASGEIWEYWENHKQKRRDDLTDKELTTVDDWYDNLDKFLLNWVDDNRTAGFTVPIWKPFAL